MVWASQRLLWRVRPERNCKRIDVIDVSDIFDIFDVFDVFDLFDLLYILQTYLLWNELIRQRKHKRGRNLKIEVLVANAIINQRFFDTHMIWPHGQCGHLALSTLLETWLKDTAFETNVNNQIIWPKIPKSKNVNFDTTIKNRNIFRYNLV